jgi:lysyl-tRNA synthetase class II
MSKSLFFIEIIPLQAEDENSEMVLLQIILEASLEEREKGFSEEFTTKFLLLVREVHLGDVVTATGSPQKWNNGRVSLKFDKIELVSRCVFFTSPYLPHPSA